MTAMHVSAAAALGAGGLAVAANLHEWMAAAPYRPSIAMALVAWPLLTLVPAFVVAILVAAVLNRWRPGAEAKAGRRLARIAVATASQRIEEVDSRRAGSAGPAPRGDWPPGVPR